MREKIWTVSNDRLRQYRISSDQCKMVNASGPPLSAFYKQASNLVENTFGYRPCLWQIRVVEALLKRDKDVVSISATASGKTLTFWMPLLLVPDGIQIVVAPLNILGKQNVDSLAKVGIRSICISAETATEENFKVCSGGRPHEYRATNTAHH